MLIDAAIGVGYLAAMAGLVVAGIRVGRLALTEGELRRAWRLEKKMRFERLERALKTTGPLKASAEDIEILRQNIMREPMPKGWQPEPVV